MWKTSHSIEGRAYLCINSSFVLHLLIKNCHFFHHKTKGNYKPTRPKKNREEIEINNNSNHFHGGGGLSMTPAAPAATAMQRSPWHSPVPYLFGGLAAMLGLIAFALLILACSYWKLSGQLNGDNNGEDLESGDGDERKKGNGRAVYEEQFVVIMAGDDKPTCLAMPVFSRTPKFFNFNIESDANINGSSSSVSDDEKGAAADKNVNGDHLGLGEASR